METAEWLDARIRKLEAEKRGLALADFGTKKALTAAKARLTRKINALCKEMSHYRSYGVFTA